MCFACPNHRAYAAEGGDHIIQCEIQCRKAVFNRSHQIGHFLGLYPWLIIQGFGVIAVSGPNQGDAFPRADAYWAMVKWMGETDGLGNRQAPTWKDQVATA